MTTRTARACMGAAVAVVFGLSAWAQEELSVKTAEAEAPQELGEAIRAALDTAAIVVSSGDKAVAEFWFRKGIPLSQAPEKPEDAVKALKEGTLVGVARFNEERRDFRDDRIKPGVYTLRFALQPQDGDHMGTAPVPYFLLLIPADVDKELEGPATHDALTTLAKGKSHPRNLNVRPAESVDGGFPRIEDGYDETKVVQLKLSGKVEGAEETPLALGVVVEGHGQI